MNPTVVRTFQRSLVNMNKAIPHQQGMPAGQWFSYLGGVAVLMAGGVYGLNAAYNYDNKIRKIFKEERTASGSKPHM